MVDGFPISMIQLRNSRDLSKMQADNKQKVVQD